VTRLQLAEALGELLVSLGWDGVRLLLRPPMQALRVHTTSAQVSTVHSLGLLAEDE